MNLTNEEDLRKAVLNLLQLGGEIGEEGYIVCNIPTGECAKCFFDGGSSNCNYNTELVAKLVSSTQFKQTYPEHFI